MEKEKMKKRIRSGYVDVYEGQTTDEDIQKGFQLIEQEKSIVGKITEEMISDGDDESDKLLTLYLESTPKERALLDCALIALCGWSLHTIIDMMTKPEDEGNAPKEGVHHANKGISDREKKKENQRKTEAGRADCSSRQCRVAAK